MSPASFGLLYRAFNSCSFDDVKVVVLGQDPYHNVNQAMGLSFSVPPGQPVPSSLKNMYRELANDCGCTVPKHGNLIKVHSAANMSAMLLPHTGHTRTSQCHGLMILYVCSLLISWSEVVCCCGRTFGKCTLMQH